MKRRQKPKMGRRPLPEGRARTVVFTLRVSPSEADAIAQAAQAESKPPTQWARDALLERIGGARESEIPSAS